MEEENKIIKRKRGRPPGSKNKKPRERRRGRPRKTDTVSTQEARQVIEEAKELINKTPRKGHLPGSKDKKPGKRGRKKKKKLTKRGEDIKRGMAEKREKTCGVRIVALIVRVDGNSRVKIKRDEMPELAPCEKLISRITFEKDGIPIHSIFKEVRNFAETLAKCAGENLLHE